MPDKIAKFIASLDSKMKKRLKEKLLIIKKDPFNAGDMKKLQGGENIYRVRIGKIRIVYQVTEAKQVGIIDIDYRGNIY